MSSASSDSDGSSILTDATSEPGDSVAEEAAEAKTATESSVREVYLICDEDAREHEDAVELVNWSTFEEWKQPWHVVPLWEGSVYDEMTLWGSIPLQNDKLRKVPKTRGKTDVDSRLFSTIFASIRNGFADIVFAILMLCH